MYSPGLPVLFLITVINFFFIYWIDKWLLLRFYRTPKNYDEICINFSLNEMKIAFIFHFLLGSAIYSNDKILTSSGATNLIKNAAQENSNSKSIFEVSRYNSYHVMTFIGGNVIIMLLILFEQTIFGYIKSTFKCLIKAQKAFEEMDAISDDYYDEMGLKFLISEYERAK